MPDINLGHVREASRDLLGFVYWDYASVAVRVCIEGVDLVGMQRFQDVLSYDTLNDDETSQGDDNVRKSQGYLAWALFDQCQPLAELDFLAWKKLTQHSGMNTWTFSQIIGPDTLVLEDEALFQNTDIARIIELFPERVTNYCAPEEVAWREKQLADYFQAAREYGDEEDVFRREEQRLGLSPDEICGKYWMYHAACVVTNLFIEDAEAQRGGGFLHVFLDDCGNVVRKMSLPVLKRELDTTFTAERSSAENFQCCAGLNIPPGI
ncbi:uncharacterized protein BDV17DRAFT_290277 [Aspergillus undulatus]|uniref:uncharacterized protein n=1 Tax=Aspergillus undulatus TaxID=1810928 RepID=UPI003CCD3450